MPPACLTIPAKSGIIAALSGGDASVHSAEKNRFGEDQTMIKLKETERNFKTIDSMYEMVQGWSTRRDKIAFRYFTAPGEIASLTYGEFEEIVSRLAAAYRTQDLKGRRVAVIGETSPMWVATYIAVILAGGVIIPMDKDLKIEEISGFLAFAEADAIAYSSSFHEKFMPLADTHPTTHIFIPMDGIEEEVRSEHYCVLPFSSLLKLGQEEIEAGRYVHTPPEDVNRMAIMLFTSGTTGTSKCVMLSEKNLTSTVNAAGTSVNYFPDDVTVSVLPIHHTYELAIVMAELNYGVEICVNDNLRHVLKNFRTFRPTALVLVPLFINTMYKKIMDEVRKKNMETNLKIGMRVSKFMRVFGVDMSKRLFGAITEAFGGRLKKIISGGAPLNPDMVDFFGEFGIQICEGYGITECSPLVAVTPYYKPKRGSVGPTVCSCRAEIRYGELNDRKFLEGEICVKGDNVMLGYYKNPEATAAAFTEDGFFRTGDIGYMDKDGYIYITGRSKSVIVLENGKNVFPEEVEEALEGIEEIEEVVVVGRKEEDGETVKLVAIVYPNLNKFPKETPMETVQQTIRDAVAAANKKLVRYKQVKEVEFRDTEFEKTTTRKIKRHLVH